MKMPALFLQKTEEQAFVHKIASKAGPAPKPPSCDNCAQPIAR